MNFQSNLNTYDKDKTDDEPTHFGFLWTSEGRYSIPTYHHCQKNYMWNSFYGATNSTYVENEATIDPCDNYFSRPLDLLPDLAEPVLNNLPLKTKYLSEEDLNTLHSPAEQTLYPLRAPVPQDPRRRLY